MLAPDERGRHPRAAAAGFAGYLIKPLRRASLVERVLAARAAARRPATGIGREDERIAAAAAAGRAGAAGRGQSDQRHAGPRPAASARAAQVDHAVSGEEAISAARTGAYDLILMDVRMPGMDGIEAAADAARRRASRRPIVALTANAFEDDRQRLPGGRHGRLPGQAAGSRTRCARCSPRWARRGWTAAGGASQARLLIWAALPGAKGSPMTAAQTPPPSRRRARRTRMRGAALAAPAQVAVMLALGFSSGLPFLLTGNTLGYWLRDERHRA